MDKDIHYPAVEVAGMATKNITWLLVGEEPQIRLK